MDFYSAYRHGFVRVAACTHHAAIGDPAANAESVLRLARAAATTTTSRSRFFPS